MTHPESEAAQPSFCYALVPCAGVGRRAESSQDKQFQPKQFHDIEGQAMVMHTLQALAGVARIRRGWVVESLDNGFEWPGAPVWPAQFERIACGGASRAHSVFNGLQALRAQGVQDHDWVLVHDAARCLVTPDWVDALIDRCWADAVGGLLALPVPDTLKAAADGRVVSTVDRADKWLAQTPQMFRFGALLEAMAVHEAAGFAGITDEASAMEMAGHAPLLVPGSAHNFKVTYPPDFALAAALLRSRTLDGVDLETHDRPAQGHEKHMMNMRIGEGWDVHALVPGRPLMVGGVQIAHTLGLLGHSDADVLVHAIIDALLGAAGLGDIGRHFPDTDAAFKGADSLTLLTEAMRRVRAQGYALCNLDSTVIAQAPKLAPYIDAMCAAIAKALAVDVAHVNVKAKTAEKLGPVGQGQSMEARAVVLLTRTQ